jgi:hypothetical protein
MIRTIIKPLWGVSRVELSKEDTEYIFRLYLDVLDTMDLNRMIKMSGDEWKDILDCTIDIMQICETYVGINVSVYLINQEIGERICMVVPNIETMKPKMDEIYRIVPWKVFFKLLRIGMDYMEQIEGKHAFWLFLQSICKITDFKPYRTSLRNGKLDYTDQIESIEIHLYNVIEKIGNMENRDKHKIKFKIFIQILDQIHIIMGADACKNKFTDYVYEFIEEIQKEYPDFTLLKI